jgi:SsrA-binding protein
MKTLARNKKAFYEYEILDKQEAGLSLRGWQVKSIKTGNISLKQSFCVFQGGELYLRGLHVSDWPGLSVADRDKAGADIKLLLHRQQLDSLISANKEKGKTIVPLSIYENRGIVKVEIALAQGKRTWDKRAKIKERESKRNIARELKSSKYF